MLLHFNDLSILLPTEAFVSGICLIIGLLREKVMRAESNQGVAEQADVYPCSELFKSFIPAFTVLRIRSLDPWSSNST